MPDPSSRIIQTPSLYVAGLQHKASWVILFRCSAVQLGNSSPQSSPDLMSYSPRSLRLPTPARKRFNIAHSLRGRLMPPTIAGLENNAYP